MAYVTNYPESMAGYGLYHTPFHPSESLKRSVLVSESELPLEDDVSTTPRIIHVSSGPDQFVHSPERSEDLIANVSLGYHLGPAQDKDQDHDQGQEQITLLMSLNEQTASLLASYSQLDRESGGDGDDDISLLEQALVMGQIALVLASSFSTAFLAPGDFVVGWPLEMAQAPGKAQAQTGGRSQNVECQAQVVLTLTNMAMALVKQFDQTGDEHDLEEAGLFYQRAAGMGTGKGVGEVNVEREHMEGISKTEGEREIMRVKRGKRKLDRCRSEGEDEGEDGHEDGNERDEVLVRLEMLGESLGERGLVV